MLRHAQHERLGNSVFSVHTILDRLVSQHGSPLSTSTGAAHAATYLQAFGLFLQSQILNRLGQRFTRLRIPAGETVVLLN